MSLVKSNSFGLIFTFGNLFFTPYAVEAELLLAEEENSDFLLIDFKLLDVFALGLFSNSLEEIFKLLFSFMGKASILLNFCEE